MTGAEPSSYEMVAHELLADPAVVTGRLFGHPCLKIGGKVFVGRRMGGWVKVPESDGDAAAAWLELADEAREFVAGAA
jgi:hypothetical protein